jgi:hypothetical protein
MPLWFVRGLRRGVVTTRYPARPDEPAAPDAVAPSGEFELATTVRSALIKKSRYGEASDEPRP